MKEPTTFPIYVYDVDLDGNLETVSVIDYDLSSGAVTKSILCIDKTGMFRASLDMYYDTKLEAYLACIKDVEGEQEMLDEQIRQARATHNENAELLIKLDNLIKELK